MTPPTCDDTRKLHSQYCALTGLQIPYTMQLHYMWEAFVAAGYSEPDLACLVRHLKQRIKDGKRPKESLLPRNLILRLDYVAEDLAVARAESRNTRTQTPKEKVLQAAGMATEKKTEARPVGSIIASCQAFNDWKEAMKKEGLI